MSVAKTAGNGITDPRRKKTHLFIQIKGGGVGIKVVLGPFRDLKVSSMSRFMYVAFHGILSLLPSILIFFEAICNGLLDRFHFSQSLPLLFLGRRSLFFSILIILLSCHNQVCTCVTTWIRMNCYLHRFHYIVSW
jgi:hypothetical protein